MIPALSVLWCGAITAPLKRALTLWCWQLRHYGQKQITATFSLIFQKLLPESPSRCSSEECDLEAVESVSVAQVLLFCVLASEWWPLQTQARGPGGSLNPFKDSQCASSCPTPLGMRGGLGPSVEGTRHWRPLGVLWKLDSRQRLGETLRCQTVMTLVQFLNKCKHVLV